MTAQLHAAQRASVVASPYLCFLTLAFFLMVAPLLYLDRYTLGTYLLFFSKVFVLLRSAAVSRGRSSQEIGCFQYLLRVLATFVCFAIVLGIVPYPLSPHIATIGLQFDNKSI